ncbi:MAG TPA: CPBP family intramembrane glutamic endopeptidase [Chthoniobacterales bacterium]|nr:CPBP family intramembrane glutamic endopeptidase [Chthoniobacterales bacterium]
MFAAASSIALGLLFVVFLGVGLLIYLALAWQVARREGAPPEPPRVTKTFGLPEAFLAVLLVLFLLTNITAAHGRSSVQLTDRDLIANLLVTLFVICFVGGYLKLFGKDIDALAGFSRTSLKRALSTGTVLLIAATPLILLAEVITQNLFGGGSSRQEIVDLFNTSRTLQQRVLIIVLAVVVAPIAEEFIFRFFIYGVVRRYGGIALGLVFNAALFAAAHNHLPSAAPLFVLGACFTLAYEWSGSILVSMSMHALFNSVQLVLLAFPSLSQQ